MTHAEVKYKELKNGGSVLQVNCPLKKGFIDIALCAGVVETKPLLVGGMEIPVESTHPKCRHFGCLKLGNVVCKAE